jgi:opine dehydrogenase
MTTEARNSSVITVLGAGNGGCAVAGSLALQGYSVNLFNRSISRLAPLQALGGVEVTGVDRTGFAQLNKITTNLEDAIQQARLLILVIPTTAIPQYAEWLAPFLLPEHIVLLNPGHTGGGLYLAQMLYSNGLKTLPPIGETATLSHASRMTSPSTVDVRLIVRNLPFSVFPARYTTTLHEQLQPYFPDFLPSKNVLETALMNINSVQHPAQALCNAGWLEHSGGSYLFYFEGTTPAIGRVIDAIDHERLLINDKLGFPLLSFAELFFRFGFTTEDGLVGGNAYSALQNSLANRWTQGPKTGLDHRYIHEDVGHGLVPMAELASSLNLDTPHMNALITLACTMNKVDYRKEGLTMSKLGLAGLAQDQINDLLWGGFGR